MTRLFFIFLFLHVHSRGRGDIRTSDLRFMMRDLRPIELPLGTRLFYF
jgi:hypothetical protein